MLSPRLHEMFILFTYSSMLCICMTCLILHGPHHTTVININVSLLRFISTLFYSCRCVPRHFFPVFYPSVGTSSMQAVNVHYIRTYTSWFVCQKRFDRRTVFVARDLSASSQRGSKARFAPDLSIAQPTAAAKSISRTIRQVQE